MADRRSDDAIIGEMDGYLKRLPSDDAMRLIMLMHELAENHALRLFEAWKQNRKEA